MFRIFILFALCASTLCASILLAENLPIQEIMTKEEMDKMGLDTATKQQKQAFEQWIGSWTQRVIEQAPTYRPGDSLLLWVQRWPAYANPKKSKLSQKDIEARLQANQHVDKVKRDGQIIELKDGSVWEISPMYTYLTRMWIPGQVIEIGTSEDIRYKRTLRNINQDRTVTANMKEPASPTGERKQEDASFYRGSEPLEHVDDLGVNIRLANKSEWTIAPVDQYKTRTWKDNDRIRVEPEDNFLYKYRLTNLDSGQEALANKK